MDAVLTVFNVFSQASTMQRIRLLKLLLNVAFRVAIRLPLTVLIRIPFIVIPCLIVLAFEYLCLGNDEQVELSHATDTPYILSMAAAMIVAIPSFMVFNKTRIDELYEFIWSCIFRVLRKGRQYFPKLVSLRMLSVLESVQRYLPMLFFGPLMLVAYLTYKTLVDWLPRYTWHATFRVRVPRFYLMLNSAHYRELNPAEPTVRLLQLLPGVQSEPIQCQMIESNVHETQFEAVSYAWGGHLVLRRSIRVNGSRFWVTQNIFQALRFLRRADEPRMLWIDQVCINQFDEKEKTDQVTQKLQHAYRNARQVIVWLGISDVWLGSSSADVSWAFNQAKLYPGERYDEASGFKIKEGGNESVERRRYVDAWLDIFQRKWFCRTWVVQEVALARHIVVRHGPDEMDWNTLQRTASDLREIHNIRISTWARALLDFVDDRARKSEKPVNLLDLAIRFRQNQVTDVRDKLMGFLALASDGRDYQGMHYRYQASLLFANFAAAHIERTKSLAILAMAEIRDHSFLEGEVCSWAFSWRAEEGYNNTTPAIIWGIGEKDSVVSRIAGYSACGSSMADCRREPGESVEFVRGIFLRGWYFDAVEAVSVSADKWNMSAVLPIWEEFTNRWMLGSKDMQTMFENVILGDIYDLEPSTTWSQWYVPQCTGTGRQDSNVSRTIKEMSSVIETLCDRRRLFITSKGKLGIGPGNTSVGDHVCVLHGSGVPSLIRKWRSFVRFASAGYLSNNGFDHTQPYHLVGQAVVSGMMYASDSDIKEQLEKNIIRETEFLLR